MTKCLCAIFPLLLIAMPVSVSAQPAPLAAAETRPQTILFIGNSFTEGANSSVLRYRPDSVTNLNGDAIGGVPALFARFAGQAGLDYVVVMETFGGTTLNFHLTQRGDVIGGAWDHVILQEYSVLDPERPGDATGYARAATALGEMFTRSNPQVDVLLMASWSRADQIYRVDGPWRGKPVAAMANDLRAAADGIAMGSTVIDGVIPVGQAWNRAMAIGLADPDPYDGTGFGQIDLWSYDQYHASAAGSYLQALVIFGQVTGVDPRTLGKAERAAHEIGLSPDQAEALQRVAGEQLDEERG